MRFRTFGPVELWPSVVIGVAFAVWVYYVVLRRVSFCALFCVLDCSFNFITILLLFPVRYIFKTYPKWQFFIFLKDTIQPGRSESVSSNPSDIQPTSVRFLCVRAAGSRELWHRSGSWNCEIRRFHFRLLVQQLGEPLSRCCSDSALVSGLEPPPPPLLTPAPLSLQDFDRNPPAFAPNVQSGPRKRQATCQLNQQNRIEGSPVSLATKITKSKSYTHPKLTLTRNVVAQSSVAQLACRPDVCTPIKTHQITRQDFSFLH